MHWLVTRVTLKCRLFDIFGFVSHFVLQLYASYPVFKRKGKEGTTGTMGT